MKTERLAVEDYMVLQSTAPWLDCPSCLIVPHNGRTFELKVSIAICSGCLQTTPPPATVSRLPQYVLTSCWRSGLHSQATHVCHSCSAITSPQDKQQGSRPTFLLLSRLPGTSSGGTP